MRKHVWSFLMFFSVLSLGCWWNLENFGQFRDRQRCWERQFGFGFWSTKRHKFRKCSIFRWFFTSIFILPSLLNLCGSIIWCHWWFRDFAAIRFCRNFGFCRNFRFCRWFGFWCRSLAIRFDLAANTQNSIVRTTLLWNFSDFNVSSPRTQHLHFRELAHVVFLPVQLNVQLQVARPATKKDSKKRAGAGCVRASCAQAFAYIWLHLHHVAFFTKLFQPLRQSAGTDLALPTVPTKPWAVSSSKCFQTCNNDLQERARPTCKGHWRSCPPPETSTTLVEPWKFSNILLMVRHSRAINHEQLHEANDWVHF